jgi:LemA protein
MYVLGVVVVLILIFVYYFNKIIRKSNRVKNSWAQIDVQLKKRVDLVPNLVETVKGYATHEKTVFENVTKARSMMMGAKTVDKVAEADNMLTGALKSLFAVSENYPQLKANENFKMLQEQLDGIESKIAYARQFYNDSVLDYNNTIQQIPANIFAGIMGKQAASPFEIVEAERKAVKVKF